MQYLSALVLDSRQIICWDFTSYKFYFQSCIYQELFIKIHYIFLKDRRMGCCFEMVRYKRAFIRNFMPVLVHKIPCCLDFNLFVGYHFHDFNLQISVPYIICTQDILQSQVLRFDVWKYLRQIWPNQNNILGKMAEGAEAFSFNAIQFITNNGPRNFN